MDVRTNQPAYTIGFAETISRGVWLYTASA
jgi:hypothetical protein